ncbi:MAG: Uncharacterised protein [Pseudidiomarina mangrovi]|nr:MAG: Uncharacterised protein [Pseudidiomarina mangrovi]
MPKIRPLLSLLAGVLAATGAANAEAAEQCAIPDQSAFEQVGQTRLKVLFWSIYDAELWTDSGDYSSFTQRVLRLNYLRSISADDLVDTTGDEWQRLGIELSADHQQWLSELRAMWPDVNEGDCLMLVEDNQGHAEFYNANGSLGRIESAIFTDHFLAIWLAENSRFDDERKQLLGVSP